MKKSTKILLCLSLIFIALGSLLTIGSMAFGVRPLQAIQNGVLDIPIYNTRDSEFSSDGRYTIPTNGIQELSIDWLAGNITIETYDGTDILLEETGSAALNNDNSLDYKIHENELKLSYCTPKAGFFCSSTPDFSKDLVIRIPESLHLTELSVDSASSDLSVKGLTLQELEADAVSGSMSVAQCVLGKVSYDSANGFLFLSDASVGEIDMDTVSGAIDGNLTNCPQKISFSGTSGDMTLTLPADSQFRVDMDTASGQLNSEFEGTYQGNVYTVGNGMAQFEIDSVSGSVHLSKAAA